MNSNFYSIPSEEVRLDWGHTLRTPDGREIQVPSKAIEALRRLGLLVKNRAVLSPAIYRFIRDRDLNCLNQALYLILGPDISGPAWCLCDCGECHRKREQADRTNGSSALSRCPSCGRAGADKAIITGKEVWLCRSCLRKRLKASPSRAALRAA